MLSLAQTLASTTVPPLRLSHESPASAGRGIVGFLFRNESVVDGAIDADGLFMLIFWFSTFFFVLLMSLMVYWCFFKYRRRPGVPAPRSPSHNGPLEIFWTVVPSSALLVIFFIGLWTYTGHQVEHGDSIKLEVRGWKWAWGVTYPNGVESQWSLPLDPGTTSMAPVFVLPEDTPVSLRMVSNDVIHSFWIPDFRVKMDVFPNRYTGYAFVTPRLSEGEPYRDHWIFCAEYCGDMHSEMAAVLRVVPWGDYQDWLQQMNTGNLSPIELGKIVHASKCATCHSVDGSANTGPTWLDLYGRDTPLANGQTVVADENYIRESIIYPAAKIHRGYANQMPPFETLREEEIMGLIAYMESISVHGSTTPDGGAEAAPDAEENAELSPEADPPPDQSQGSSAENENDEQGSDS